SAMSYEGIRITEELSESSQRAVGIPPHRHDTLGELVKDMARRGDPRGEEPPPGQPPPPPGQGSGGNLHPNTLGDALALPFVLGDKKFEVRSESPLGGEVRATVTKDGVDVSPPDAVISVGATRVGAGPVQATACPYINAFPSRADYERWAAA